MGEIFLSSCAFFSGKLHTHTYHTNIEVNWDQMVCRIKMPQTITRFQRGLSARAPSTKRRKIPFISKCRYLFSKFCKPLTKMPVFIHASEHQSKLSFWLKIGLAPIWFIIASFVVMHFDQKKGLLRGNWTLNNLAIWSAASWKFSHLQNLLMSFLWDFFYCHSYSTFFVRHKWLQLNSTQLSILFHSGVDFFYL